MNNLYINQLETENKQLREALKQVRAGTNELTNELNKKLDAQDKIINEQALEIARLKEDKQKALEYIKNNKDNTYQTLDFENGKSYNIALLEVEKILGDKENE